MFRITLNEILQERLRIKSDVISKYVDKLLQVEGLEVFTIVESFWKIKVIQIHRQKFKAARIKLETLF
jgi:hypothetical protein